MQREFKALQLIGKNVNYKHDYKYDVKYRIINQMHRINKKHIPIIIATKM